MSATAFAPATPTSPRNLTTMPPRPVPDAVNREARSRNSSTRSDKDGDVSGTPERTPMRRISTIDGNGECIVCVHLSHSDHCNNITSKNFS